MTRPCVRRRFDEEMPRGVRNRWRSFFGDIAELSQTVSERGVSGSFGGFRATLGRVTKNLADDVAGWLRGVNEWTASEQRGRESIEQERRDARVRRHGEKAAVRSLERELQAKFDAILSKEQQERIMDALWYQFHGWGSNATRELGLTHADVAHLDSLLGPGEEVAKVFAAQRDMLIRQGRLPEEAARTLEGEYYLPHAWKDGKAEGTKGDDFWKARRAIELEKGLEFGDIFGRLSFPERERRGDSVGGSGKRGAGVPRNPSNLGSRKIEILPGEAEVSAAKARLERQAEEFEKAAERAETEGNQAEADKNEALADAARDAARRTITFADAKRAGLETDVRKLVEEAIGKVSRTIEAEDVLNLVEGHLAKPYIDSKIADQDGYGSLVAEFNLDADAIVKKVRPSPALSKFTEEMPVSVVREANGAFTVDGEAQPTREAALEAAAAKGGLIVRRDADGWVVASPDGHYGEGERILNPLRADGDIHYYTSAEEAWKGAKAARLRVSKLVLEEINRPFQEMTLFGSKQLGHIYDMAGAAFREGKVVLSPGSHSRQMLSNYIMAGLHPDYALVADFGTGAKPLWDVARQGFEELRAAEAKTDPRAVAYRDRAIRAGAIVPEAVLDLHGAASPAGQPQSWPEWRKWIHEALLNRKLGGVSVNDVRLLASQAWLAEDNILRYSVWRDQARKFEAQNEGRAEKWTTEEIDRMALDEVDRLLPNPDRLPSFVRKFSRHMMFTGFTWELGRVMGGHLSRAMAAALDGSMSPTERVRAAAPALKMLAGIAGMKFAGEAVLSAYGYDEKEIAMIKRNTHAMSVFLPSPFGDDPVAVNLTYALPMGDWLSFAPAPIGSQDVPSYSSTFDRVLGYGKVPLDIARQAALSNPFATLAAELAFGKDSFTGRDLFPDSATNSEKLGVMAATVFDTFAPSFLNYSIGKGTQWALGEKNLVGKPKTTLAEFVAGMVGFPLADIDPKELAAYDAIARQKRARELRSDSSRARRRGDDARQREIRRRLRELE